MDLPGTIESEYDEMIIYHRKRLDREPSCCTPKQLQSEAAATAGQVIRLQVAWDATTDYAGRLTLLSFLPNAMARRDACLERLVTMEIASTARSAEASIETPSVPACSARHSKPAAA